MSLEVGTRIGPYEVTAPLGEGRMGVVFRARDTRLQRDVALKLLPDHLARDDDRLKRFEREARLLASLNHPNIAHIYGLEPLTPSATVESPSGWAIAMELVEGETLAERLEARGSMSTDEAVGIATQIASALQAAHERGIVHRDLKPSNIKLTSDGTVKVLDFGLAKEVEMSGAAAVDSSAPTASADTMPGVIMGTLPYMSPEQVRGKTVDARADIWAFGCVVYEMLTGRRAFAGETATDISAAIVSGEPRWDRLPKTTRSGLRQLLRVTLIKDLRERLQHIGDSRLFLARGVFPEITAETRDDRRSHRVWIAVAISSAMLLAALAAGSWYLRREPPAAPAMRFEIPAPGFIPQPAGLGVLSISPDGQHIAYVASVEGGTRIMLRPVAQAVARGLPGTENATGLFWSPSNRDLGFTASGKLKKIDITSGTVRDLADASAIAGGTWNADDVILFGAGPGRASFLRVTASGGSVSSIPIDDAPRSAVSLYQPIFLPDGRHILYHALTPMDRAFVATVYARVVDSGPAKQITDLGDPSMTTGSSPAIFATPSYLMFTKSGTLFVQRIDVDRLEAVGDPVPIAENVGTYAVSNTGVLVYAGPPPTSQPGTSIPSSFTLRRQLTWVSRSGAFERTIGDPSTYGNPRLSPDGRRIAVQRIESGTGDIWSIDDTSGLASRQTFDPSEEGVPIWSPQGDRLLFTSSRGTLLPFPNSLYERAANGAGGERLILQGEVGELLIPQDWSVDGLVAFERVPSARLLDGGDLWVMPLMGDKKPFPLVQVARGRARAARFSPDGRWVSYSIDESGTSRIVVRPFPDVKKGIWQVPGTSGTEAIWRRDGRELFYLTPDRTMMAVPVTLGESPRFDQPVKLFTTNLPPQTNPAQFVYDVSADGQHFLLNLLADDPAKARPPATPVPPSPATQLTVIINWTSLLKK